MSPVQINTLHKSSPICRLLGTTHIGSRRHSGLPSKCQKVQIDFPLYSSLSSPSLDDLLLTRCSIGNKTSLSTALAAQSWQFLWFRQGWGESIFINADRLSTMCWRIHFIKLLKCLCAFKRRLRSAERWWEQGEGEEIWYSHNLPYLRVFITTLRYFRFN